MVQDASLLPGACELDDLDGSCAAGAAREGAIFYYAERPPCSILWCVCLHAHKQMVSQSVVCAADAAAARMCQRAGGQALFGMSSRNGGWAAEGRSAGLDIPKPCARVLAMERDGSDGSYASAFSLDMFSPGDPLLGAAGQGLLAASCDDHGLLSADCGAFLLRCLRGVGNTL